MMKINQDYLYIDEWSDLSQVDLGINTFYFYAHDPELRSAYCADQLIKYNSKTQFIQIEFDDEKDVISLVDTSSKKISLHSSKEIGDLFSPCKDGVVYLEVTGLSCRVAAPLMKYALQNGIEMRIVYVEPSEYNLLKFWNLGVNKDLCEKVKGINPLPGLANIIPHKDPPLFVVLLGFEGGRLSYMLQNQSPDNNQIVPILGVPGYRLHYPFLSIWGNRNHIRSTKCWQRLRYAEANSIVDIYMLLKKLHENGRGKYMIVAPLGTKPHAIGAILYSIKNSRNVEIVYDNPMRNVPRTNGIGKVLVCNISKLYNDN